MKQCRGGCSHEMVKSPAIAVTMAYPMEEENRSHRRIAGINGDDDDDYNDDDDDDDDIVRGNGNREARSRDLDACRACGFKNDKNDFLSYSSNQSNGSSKNDVFVVTSNNYFTYSYSQLLGQETEAQLLARLCLSQLISEQDEKENKRGPSKKRSRKQSQPRQVKWHWDSWRNLIPALGLQDLTNVESNNRQKDDSGKIDCGNIMFKHQQKSIRQRMYKCHLCRKYAPARGIKRRPYHNKASLILHTLWRHKGRSCHAKNRMSTVCLPSTVSSITLKATFFTNYSYHR